MAVFPFKFKRTPLLSASTERRKGFSLKGATSESKGAIEKIKTGWQTICLRFGRLTESNYALAHYHVRAGNDFDAGMRFRFVLRRKPNDAEAQFYLGRLYLRSPKDKTYAEGARALRRLAEGGAMAGESKYALATESREAEKRLPRRVPFRLMCDAEQNLTQFKDEVLPRYMRIDALCVPAAAEEMSEDGEMLRPAQPRLCALCLGSDMERKYAMQLVNLMTESLASPSGKLLLLGDRYGQTGRYLDEKDAFPARVNACLPRFIPEMPEAGQEAKPKRAEKGPEIASLPDATLSAPEGFDAVVVPYWGLYYGKPSDMCNAVPALRQGGVIAFGTLESDAEAAEPAAHFTAADVFTHNPAFVRKDMEQAGYEYIAARPFTANGRPTRRQLYVFRKRALPA
ncbi:MAG: hypothetical protein ABW189_09410 [Rickettsiales bacterium]